MKTIEQRERRITAIAIVILIAGLISTGIFYTVNRSQLKNLNSEKLKSEMMLSEKLALQKEIENFRNQINSLSGKNSELDKLLAETSKKLSEKEAQLSRVVRENGNIKTLKKELADLNQMKKDFESQVFTLNESIRKLNSEKDALNQTIASLQEENKQLAANYEILNSMTADNYLVETTKRKDRLTVVARRTKKITVSFKVPENIVEDISFKILKPDGKIVEGKDKGVACRIVNEDEGLTASINGGAIKVSKKIEMTYEPKEKQKPGLYQIEMYNGEKYIGTCNVKLR
jgi:predicted  nucleic acid-binding Zn-ribbon protein